MSQSLSYLIQRLKPFMIQYIQQLSVTPTEGPGIDIVAPAQIGLGGDTILLYDSAGAPVAEFAATAAGLTAALAAATANDEIHCPYHITITHNAGFTIPASVKVRDLVLGLACTGNGITMSNGSELWHSVIYQDGGNGATATAIYADGLASGVINNVVAYATRATIAIGIKAGGTGKFTRISVGNSNGTATAGKTNYGIFLTDYGLAFSSTGTAQDGTTANIGITLAGSTAAKAATVSQCSFFARGTLSYGLNVGNGYFGIASACTFDGVTGGVVIDAGGTLYAADNYWTSITRNGVLVYLQGDRRSLSIPATKTTTYAITQDNEVVLADATGGAFDVDLPAAAGCKGWLETIKKIDSSANAVTVDPDGVETIDADTTLILDSQYSSAQIVCDGTEWWIV